MQLVGISIIPNSEHEVNYTIDNSYSSVKNKEPLTYIKLNKKGAAFIVAKTTSNTISQTAIFEDETSSLIITGEIRLYNTPELTKELKTAYISNHQLVLEAYKKFGKNCLQLMNGDFSFVIWNTQSNELFCARDPLGQKPYYYSFDGNTFQGSTHFKFVHSTNTNNVLNDDWIHCYLTLQAIDKVQTIFKNINRLAPGHLLTLKNKQLHIERYWDISKIQKVHIQDVKMVTSHFKKEIRRAVQERINNSTNIGVELSGGLDSSAVTALVQETAKNKNIELDAYTNVLSEKDKQRFPDFYDEWDKAASVVKNANIKNHIPVDEPATSTTALIDLMLDKHGMPSPFLFSANQSAIYQQAALRHNRILFSGYGGDELISEVASKKYLQTVLSNDGFTKLFKVFKLQGYGLFKSGYHTLRAVKNKLLNEELKIKQKLFVPFWNNVVLKDELIKKENLKTKFFESFYFPINQTLNERSIYNLNKGGLSERLETGYSFTNDLDINYSFPLLDIKLIEYYYSLSDELKGNHTVTRFLFREVCKDLLPPSIVNQGKPSNSFTIPFLMIEFNDKIKELADLCLLIPDSNTIFNYVDREKLITLINSINKTRADNKRFKVIANIIMLNRFFNMHNL